MNVLEEIPGPRTMVISSPSNSPFHSSYTTYQPSSYSSFDLDWKWIIIFSLCFIIVMTGFGINLISILGTEVQKTTDLVFPWFSKLLHIIGYTTGTTINTTADIVGTVAKETVDITEGTFHDVGNIMLGEPKPDDSQNNIQKPLASAKTKWCLVGEFQNKRGCIDILDSEKCLSGQVFPNEKMCLNPNLG